MSTPRSTKSRSIFALEVAVTATIRARPERIWSLLTDIPNYTRWNSTLTSIEGSTELGEVVRMRVPEAPGRVFKVKVVEHEANRRMVWRDGFAPMFVGARTYLVEPVGEGASQFTMTEKFTGVMLPMIAGKLPDFQPIFERYAADLTREAEKT